jgi:hypothetical protein
MSENLTTKELILRVEAEIKEDIQKLEEQLDKMWTAIDKIKNRPPVWVTFLFMTLTALIGYLIKGG